MLPLHPAATAEAEPATACVLRRFGIKGGAAGGGYSQVIPMEEVGPGGGRGVGGGW